MGEFFFLKLNNAVLLLPQKAFFHRFFFNTKPFIAMKKANHHDKQLTPSESWDQDGYFEPGFEVSSNLNREAQIFTTLWHPNQGEHLERLIYK